MQAVGDADTNICAFLSIAEWHIANTTAKAFEMEGQAKFLDEHGRALAEHLGTA